MDRELEQLQHSFAMPGVTLRRGAGDFIYIAVENEFGVMEICRYGAQVLGYVPPQGDPVIWMSRRSNFIAGKAIRGGVPICWPYFGAHPTDPARPAHGFARIADWQLAAVERLASGATKVRFHLDRALLPEQCCCKQDFELEYSVTLGRQLTMKLTMTNCDVKIMEVSAALHSYFAVADICATSVEGLSGAEYIDSAAGGRGRETGAIRFAGEVDRIFTDTDAEIVIDDAAGGRRIAIERIGSRSAVVWNPWTAKAAKLPDFGDDEYKHMLCVEAALVRDDMKRLAPGESWTLSCRIARQ